MVFSGLELLKLRLQFLTDFTGFGESLFIKEFAHYASGLTRLAGDADICLAVVGATSAMPNSLGGIHSFFARTANNNGAGVGRFVFFSTLGVGCRQCVNELKGVAIVAVLLLGVGDHNTVRQSNQLRVAFSVYFLVRLDVV